LAYTRVQRARTRHFGLLVQVRAAAVTAFAHDFITELPQG
jgi:hypothetical protein